MRAVWGWKGGVWGSAPSRSFRIRGTEWRSRGYEGWRGGKQWIVGEGTKGYCQHCVGHQWSHYFSKGGYLFCPFVLLLLCRIKMCVLTTICGKLAFCLVHCLCRNSHTLCIFHIMSAYNFKPHMVTAAGLLLYGSTKFPDCSLQASLCSKKLHGECIEPRFSNLATD